jgi:hypothetical protein
MTAVLPFPADRVPGRPVAPPEPKLVPPPTRAVSAVPTEGPYMKLRTLLRRRPAASVRVDPVYSDSRIHQIAEELSLVASLPGPTELPARTVAAREAQARKHAADLVSNTFAFAKALELATDVPRDAPYSTGVRSPQSLSLDELQDAAVSRVASAILRHGPRSEQVAELLDRWGGIVAKHVAPSTAALVATAAVAR